MSNKQNFTYDPFATDILSYIDAAIARALQGLQTCIPAIVSKVIDRNTVVVTPAVQQMNSRWETVEWADIKLPVHNPFGAGIVVSMPVAVGDTGWIIAGDLDPSLFIKTIAGGAKPARQNILNRHAYQFGFFIPDKISGANISAADDGALVVQTSDGDTKISIKDGTITIASKSALNINAETITITGGQNVTINNTDWATHTHSVGSLSVPVTSAEGSPSTITGSTGGVE